MQKGSCDSPQRPLYSTWTDSRLSAYGVQSVYSSFEVLYDYANIRNKSGLINGTEESRGLEPVLKSVGPKHPLRILTSV